MLPNEDESNDTVYEIKGERDIVVDIEGIEPDEYICGVYSKVIRLRA